MSKLIDLINTIETARTNFLVAVGHPTAQQAKFKPTPAEWSILEITEHMVWAEQIGICGMVNAIEGLKNGRPIWEDTSPNQGLSIEQIVAKTWQPKEKVPKVAEPKWGGALLFWKNSLQNCRHLLKDLEQQAKDVNIELAIYPHPISGPMNVIQRLEFLRFHLERHTKQVIRVKESMDFPHLE